MLYIRDEVFKVDLNVPSIIRVTPGDENVSKEVFINLWFDCASLDFGYLFLRRNNLKRTNLC